ncbi:Prolyl 4-hydroxylase subunit alpha-2 [Folsomia candida]|uniref:procollagen-proline 4-dioxygenase n=1 Tax=Folsomia candida TaxID=158441 RepID=A0A226EEY6_FOLCA|nr:Prolyl 4-hydroxylase subunit alpha-2 [Folsomia candida]
MVIPSSLKRLLTFKIKVPVLLVLCCSFLQFCSCDIFTAQVELESIFDLRKSVSGAVVEYLRQEELRLALVREKFEISSGLSRIGVVDNGEEYRKKLLPGEDVSISGESENYDILNPINAFLAIKALSVDLADLVKHAMDNTNMKSFNKLMESLSATRKFPDKDDLKGAAIALTRLQDTYLLKTEDLSEGCLQDDFCTVTLSVQDCIEIGRQNYQERSYDHAIPWFEEALRKLDEQESHLYLNSNNNETNLEIPIKRGPPKPTKTPFFTELSNQTRESQREEIIEYISWSNDIKNTLSVGKQFLAELTGIELDAFIDEVVKAAESQPTDGEAEDSYSTVLKKYEALCRGESRDFISQNPSLKCTLSTRANNPYFMIGPVKEEQLHVDPPLWVFHDVIYNSEIEVIKAISKPLFKTATVVNSATGGTEQSTTRISKSAWVINDDDDVVRRVNKRIMYLTNLDLYTAEDLQVANYGIGGMYLPHFDFSHTNETIKFLPKEEGNRIATLMFYMSDVRVGGGTAFPHLNLTIWPEKGAAAFWYNLKPDGRGDYRTQHGACPVLIGSKWGRFIF